MSYQKYICQGHLGKDPEMNGPVCRLSVAVDDSYTTKDGKRVDQTEWVRVTVFGKTGENCKKFLAKGQSVLVEGRLRTSSYEKDGQKRYSTDVIAERVVFGPNKSVSSELRASSEDPTSGYEPETPPGDEEIPF
jgi:single-strand DNA-binding protein